MSQIGSPERALWVQRVPGLDGFGLWVVCEGDPSTLGAPQVKEWQAAAERSMALRAEVASLSLVTPGVVTGGGTRSPLTAGMIAQASAAALPLAFLSGRAADLIGISAEDDQRSCPMARFEGWIETATRKGLVHHWLAVDSSAWSRAGLGHPARAVPACDDGAVQFPDARAELVAGSAPSGLSLGIDAAWLSGPESGAQVAVLEMVRELATRPEIKRILLVSDTGHVPGGFNGIAKVSGLSWPAALATGAPVVDILHRPYQPGADVDYRRYHQVARCVALTVLDFIAYDNPEYHESHWSWRKYQQAFDERVCLADCVFAISRYVASRVERQCAHQLSGPVYPVPLGTDHLLTLSDADETDEPGPVVQALGGKRFLLVLGNDFEHKNRDFAVRVFVDMCDRGYDGQLVLAGFHLDRGSSFGHELSGAGHHVDRVARMGAVSGPEKRWLMRHAQAVLYPTSSEGFGLVPFEAAALGTPTAFVRFGPLRETLPGVDACAGWQVRAFADHVFRLLADPISQVEQIREAGAALTWSAHVGQVLEGYRHLLRDGAPWRTRTRALPGRRAQIRQAMEMIAYRAQRKLRRVFGLNS